MCSELKNARWLRRYRPKHFAPYPHPHLPAGHVPAYPPPGRGGGRAGGAKPRRCMRRSTRSAIMGERGQTKQAGLLGRAALPPAQDGVRTVGDLLSATAWALYACASCPI